MFKLESYKEGESLNSNKHITDKFMIILLHIFHRYFNISFPIKLKINASKYTGNAKLIL